MLRTAGTYSPVILFPGRFQPPHKGHFEVVKQLLTKYPDGKIVISIDNREIDRDNLLDIDVRIGIFKSQFPNRVEVLTHNTKHHFSLTDYFKTIYSQVIKVNADIIIMGKDYPKEYEDFFTNKGIVVKKIESRYFNISSSFIRDNLNISIITNFGCRTNCWYCIWKEHRLKDVQLETDWDKLYKFIKANQHKGKLSVSGGGDCLFNFEKYREWWNKLFKICNELKIQVDVHSREKFYDMNFWQKINRCVASSDFLKDDIEYFKWLRQYSKLRITHVVTEFSTIELIKEYLDFCVKYDCQFTIKELVGYNDNGNYKLFKQQYPSLFALEAGDYNIYYMPDNSITHKFL